MSLFNSTRGLSPRRSVFNLSYSRKFSAQMGILYPVCCDEMVPGDKFSIASRALVRALPLVTPVMHNVRVQTDYFFVPYRLLFDDWETFITRGVDGDTTVVLPTLNPDTDDKVDVGSLWDYLGFPTRQNGIPATTQYTLPLAEGSRPLAFPLYAYNDVWNTYYRDQNLQDEIGLDENWKLLRRAWKKDYFTSCLPFQQRGTPPAIYTEGDLSAMWPDSRFLNTDPADYSHAGFVPALQTNPNLYVGNPNSRENASNFFNSNTISLDNFALFTPNQLRLAFQVQKWQERNARAGVRYPEFLQSHFGVSPRDDRLQRPEYIGSTVQPLIFSEVLQTSESATTPQGTLAGHGISVDSGSVGSYFAQEYGLVLGLFSIVPESVYQQGMPRQWMRKTTFDFYFPEFANLSEQAVLNHEIYFQNSADDQLEFGFQGRFNELRYKPSTVHGLMRTSLSNWHLSRIFDACPELDPAFISCDPDTRVFAVENQDHFVVDFANLIRAVRPLPISPEPGLIDHN